MGRADPARAARTARAVAAALALGAALALSVPLAWAQDRVTVPSLDRTGGEPVALVGFWYPVAVSGAPAAVLLHGCGGAYDRSGQLSARMVEYAQLLNRAGVNALVLDSLTARGQKELCTQRIGTRTVTQANRRLDALGAVDWLAHRTEVDARRIGLMGWSNGGSSVLAALNTHHPAVASAPTKPSFAVAFYPGCEAELKRGFRTGTRLLMLVGELDDWTAAAPCQALARASATEGAPAPQIETYAGAYHGFDSAAPVRLRKDVPNGVNPGQGVHVGGNADARSASRESLLRFLGSL